MAHIPQLYHSQKLLQKFYSDHVCCRGQEAKSHKEEKIKKYYHTKTEKAPLANELIIDIQSLALIYYISIKYVRKCHVALP